MRKIFAFQEFDPKAYSAGPNWGTIAKRYLFMASIVVVPSLVGLLQFLHAHAPALTYFMAAIAALYLPALALIRRPKATCSDDFKIKVTCPKTVDTRLLKQASASALAYFILVTVAVMAVWR